MAEHRVVECSERVILYADVLCTGRSGIDDFVGRMYGDHSMAGASIIGTVYKGIAFDQYIFDRSRDSYQPSASASIKWHSYPSCNTYCSLSPPFLGGIGVPLVLVRVKQLRICTSGYRSYVLLRNRVELRLVGMSR